MVYRAVIEIRVLEKGASRTCHSGQLLGKARFIDVMVRSRNQVLLDTETRAEGI